MKRKITEEDKVHEEWYKEARDMTPEKLSDFIRKLTEDYEHNYGTICHAASAAAVAAARAIDHSPTGGITGFQAGCIMWGFVQNWMGLKSPLRMINYEDMLYPQHDYKYEKTISKDVWEWLQEEAKKKIEEHPNSNGRVVEHWKSIVDGKIPFGYKAN